MYVVYIQSVLLAQKSNTPKICYSECLVVNGLLGCNRRDVLLQLRFVAAGALGCNEYG